MDMIEKEHLHTVGQQTCCRKNTCTRKENWHNTGRTSEKGRTTEHIADKWLYHRKNTCTSHRCNTYTQDTDIRKDNMQGKWTQHMERRETGRNARRSHVRGRKIDLAQEEHLFALFTWAGAAKTGAKTFVFTWACGAMRHVLTWASRAMALVLTWASGAMTPVFTRPSIGCITSRKAASWHTMSCIPTISNAVCLASVTVNNQPSRKHPFFSYHHQLLYTGNIKNKSTA